MNAPSQAASASIRFAEKSSLISQRVLNRVCWIGSACFGVYLFDSNTGGFVTRFCFALAGGLIFGIVSDASLSALAAIFLQFRRQACDHQSALLQRMLWGVVVGMVLAFALSDLSDGPLPALRLAGLLGAAGGVAGALSMNLPAGNSSPNSPRASASIDPTPSPLLPRRRRQGEEADFH